MLEYVQAASCDRCVVCWPAERHEFQHHALNTTVFEEPLGGAEHGNLRTLNVEVPEGHGTMGADNRVERHGRDRSPRSDAAQLAAPLPCDIAHFPECHLVLGGPVALIDWHEHRTVVREWRCKDIIVNLDAEAASRRGLE